MAIQVLLRRNIDGVGEVGQTVRVKNGFARNYLLPKGYAALVTPDAMRRIEKDKSVEAQRQAELSAYHDQVVKQLEEMSLTLEVRAGEDGHLYGSVTSRHILAAFEEAGYRLKDRQIRFETVRELGNYEIPVHLSPEHVVNVDLWVVQDVQDIEAMKAASEAAAQAEAEGEGESGEDGAPVADGDQPVADAGDDAPAGASDDDA